MQASSTVQAILDKLNGVRATESGWLAKCPAHEDAKASLSVGQGENGRALLKCFAGCSPNKIITSLGLKLVDLLQSPQKTASGGSKIVATYDYLDAQGKLLHQTVRFDPKRFKQRRPDGKAGWIWSLRGVRTVLYHLPQIEEAVARGQHIYLVEGEKDVATMVEHGFVATCNPMGAKKWKPNYSETLRGATVFIIPDNDNSGREHAELVASELSGIAKRVRVIELPAVKGSNVKDAADYFHAGGTDDAIIELSDAALSKETPATVTEPLRGGWFKASRSTDAFDLQLISPNAFRLAWLIAYRTRYTPGMNRYGINVGEAMLGDYRNYRMSKQEYRTAKAVLKKFHFATFRITPFGTVAKLIDTRLFEVMPLMPNTLSNTLATPTGRTENGRVVGT